MPDKPGSTCGTRSASLVGPAFSTHNYGAELHMRIATLALASIGLFAGVACQTEGGAENYEVTEATGTTLTVSGMT